MKREHDDVAETPSASDICVLKKTRHNVGDVIIELTAPKRMSKKRNRKDMDIHKRNKSFKAINYGGATLSSDKDESYVDYIIEFDPPMLYDDAFDSSIVIKYAGPKNCVGDICLNLIPDAPMSTSILKSRVLEYVVFPTHQLQVTNATDVKDGKTNQVKITKLYLRAENNLTFSGGTTEILMEPSVDLGALILKPTFGARYIPLDFFPPDINPADYELEIDPRYIPQRCPLWFKMRADVSGSKSYKFVGFFIPPKTSKEGQNWSFNNPEPMTPFQKARMCMGVLSEDPMTAAYLTRYPNRIFSEIGACSVPHNLGYPLNWGASPDGLVCDPDMTLSKIPQKYRKHLGLYPGRFDVTKGVVEFKASAKKLSLEAYFLPQLYMEMIATNTCWADLVRYKRTSTRDDTTGKWVYTHQFRVYRVYRHKPTEDMLVKCLRYASTNKHILQDVVQQKQFKDLRSFFKEVSTQRSKSQFVTIKVKNKRTGETYEKQKSNYDTITVTPELHELISRHTNTRISISRAGLPKSTKRRKTSTENKKEEMSGLEKMWLDMENRFEMMKDMFHDASSNNSQYAAEGSRAEFVHLAANQIQDLGRLINMTLE